MDAQTRAERLEHLQQNTEALYCLVQPVAFGVLMRFAAKGVRVHELVLGRRVQEMPSQKQERSQSHQGRKK
jgi:hypothetical protein